MNKLNLWAVLFFFFCISTVRSDLRTGSAIVSGSLEMPLNVEALVKTEVTFYSENTDWKSEPEAHPFPFTGEWEFLWNSDTPNEVVFNGDVRFGNYYSITDAGELGGVTKQVYYNFSHIVSGTALWDETSHTLSYELLPKKRDDGQASLVVQDKAAECFRIKGIGANKACRAFNDCSLELEGLVLCLRFNEDLTAAEGEILMIQYGGSGITKSLTEAKSQDWRVQLQFE